MMRGTYSFALASAVLGAALLAGCGGSPSTSSSAAPAGAANTGASGSAATTAPAAAAPAPAPASAVPPVVVPAGTTLHVRLDQAVTTKNDEAGDKFDATLSGPVRVNGEEVIRSGARVTGRVTSAGEAGHIKGSATLSLVLDSITVDGRKYSIETATISEQGKGRGKRTAEGTGVGAAAGAIIGAIAGGGKGAAIGAGAGAGAGAAGTALTGNRDLTLPAETPLSFRLRNELTLHAS